MTCIECGLRPRHKRYHRCHTCLTWKSSTVSRKGPEFSPARRATEAETF